MRSVRSMTPIRTAKIGYIVLSAILCCLGIVLIAAPSLSISVIGSICGAVLILFGAVKLVGYFSKDLYRLAFQYDLSFGLLMMVLGAVLLLLPQQMMSVICIVLGISVLADGLFKIQIAADAKQFGLHSWWLILALAILAGLLGFLLVFRSAESARTLTVLLGVVLLSEGVLNLGTVISAVKIVKHQMPDEIDAADIFEESEDEP